MNTSNKISKILGRGSLLVLFATAALSSAHARPDPDYWRRTQQNRWNQNVTQTSVPAPASKECATARTEAVTDLRPAMPNGKGALKRVAAGSRQVCDSCATTTVMKPSLRNGKGPLRPVQITSTHICDASCKKA
ncbi:hypothetical protein OH491_22725 [Termitidicoccus mucosus]|uniref:Uncharacterized protein n=1 Tax=Termitidicoccus mucosus TaxID=1184151 RepID=A0A178IN54_9BACT|nr:hypothetical protein AW736_03745 [Opitutaceae bacterium TSB47]